MSAPHLTDFQFNYPAHLSVTENVARVQACLARAKANRGVLLNPALGLPQFGVRICLKAGISPLVWLIALEREESLFTEETDAGSVAGEFDVWDWPKAGFMPASLIRPATALRPCSSRWNHAAGVVGQDKPGTVNRNWDGLLPQLLITVELHAWYMGIGPDQNFGFRSDLWCGAAGRWPRTKTVEILDSRHQTVEIYTAASATEYAQLTYTPHLGTTKLPDGRIVNETGGMGNVLDVNSQIAQMFPEFL